MMGKPKTPKQHDAYIMLPDGGRVFVESVVNDILAWVQNRDDPVFVLQTSWNNNAVREKARHVPFCIQYTGDATVKRRKVIGGGAARERQWCLTCVPLTRAYTEKGVRVRKVEWSSDDKVTYHFDDDDDVVQLLRNCFEIDAWRDGHPETTQIEALPRLYSVDRKGYLKRVRTNTSRHGALDLDDWEAMVGCYLNVIKLLTKGSCAK